MNLNQNESVTNPSWKMFNINQTLGEGAYGKVYMVKCLKSSILSGEGKGLDPTMRLKKKLNKNMIGSKMVNTSSTRFLKELLVD